MHISEGVLTPEVLIAGAAGAAIGLGIGLRRLKSRDIPKVALLTAAFFVASLIHVPVGPSSAHLILNGLLGIILGWEAFPAIFIGLTLQAVLFQFGGLTTLGVNTLNMALPAVLAGLVARPFMKQAKATPLALVMAGVMAACSIMLSALMVSLSLAFSGQGLATVGKLIFVVHIPVALIEAVITSSVVGFLLKVKPEIIVSAEPGDRAASDMGKTGMAAAVFLFAILFSCPAHAHKVNVFAWYDGKQVEISGYFSSGVKARDSQVIVEDEHGNEVFKGKTDAQGQLSFVPPGKGKYHLVLKAGMGHMAEADFEVGTVSAGTKSSAAASAGAVPGSMAETEQPQDHGLYAGRHPVTAASGQGRQACLTRDELENILDQRLKPVRRELMLLAEQRDKIKMSDVISGLGYIMGLAGIALYLSARQKHSRDSGHKDDM